MEVRLAARAPGVKNLTAGVIITLASAGFIAGGAAHPASVGGVLFLVLGCLGLLLCLGTAVVAAGGVLSRRPPRRGALRGQARTPQAADEEAPGPPPGYWVVSQLSSSRVPNPVAPLVISPSSDIARAGPAMSRCAHGRPPVNSRRNSAAVI